MKTVRVTKSIMDKLNAKGYAVGTKYAYRVRTKIYQNCSVVERIPLYYYHRGINPGWRVCTDDYARRNGLSEILLVKGA